jgi:hypothetical protein
MHRQHTAAPASTPEHRQCSRCGVSKPATDFYANPATVCKGCQNLASRFTNACRRAAIAHLIATYSTEYQALLETERTKRQAGSETSIGGDSDAA